MSRFTVLRGDLSVGPFRVEDLQQGFNEGRFEASDRVRDEESGQTLRLSALIDTSKSLPGEAPGETSPVVSPTPESAPQAADAHRQPAPAPPPATAQPTWQPQAPWQPFPADPQASPWQPEHRWRSVAERHALPPLPPLPGWAVLVLGAITCGSFGIVWSFMQALWVKKLQPKNLALKQLFVFLGFGVGVPLISLVVSYILDVQYDRGDIAGRILLGGLASLGAGTIFFCLAQLSVKQGIESVTSRFGADRTVISPAFNVLLFLTALVFCCYFVGPGWIQHHFDKLSAPSREP